MKSRKNVVTVLGFAALLCGASPALAQVIGNAQSFAIVGGSEETHGRMTETVVKTFEELKTRKKQLHQVEPDELAEILHKSTPR